MKKLILGAAIALLPLTGFSATILGIQAGAGTWKHDPSGQISTNLDGAGVTADLKNDLKLSEDSEGYAYFSIEHPIPLIPNVKFVNTKLTSSGSGAVNFDFNGVTYSSAVNTKLQLDQTDIILYYEILDNVVSLDVGIDAKKIDGSVVVDTDITSFNETVPMLYVAAEIMLPAGFTLNAEISKISSGGDSMTDTQAKLTYTTDYNLGVEVGVRTLSIDVDVDSVKADIEFSGVFAGVYFKF